VAAASGPYGMGYSITTPESDTPAARTGSWAAASRTNSTNDQDDRAPKSEPSSDAPPHRVQSKLGGFYSKHKATISSNPNSFSNGHEKRVISDKLSSSPAKLEKRSSIGSMTPMLKEMAMMKEQRRHSILLKLTEIETNYDALFARRMRENAANSLDRDTLQRDVRRVRAAGKRANRLLIQPHGGFMQLLDVLTMFALIFTAVVSPYEIAFLSDYDSPVLDATNFFVLGIFAVGLVCTFFVPYREAAWKGGALVRDHGKIALKYAQTWLFFDLLSTLPLDYFATIGSPTPLTTDPYGNLTMDSSDQMAALRVVRASRLVRLVRLTRLINLGRLLRAQRIIARLAEPLEQRSELLNISFTVKTSLFWVVIILMVLHWYCCIWGILALIQDTQRTPALAAALSDECRAAARAYVQNMQYVHPDCLVPCEIDTLAVLEGLEVSFVSNEEPWVCRRISEGLFTGRSSMSIYFHLLYHQGLLRNVAGKTGRAEENLIFFILAFVYLVINTLFIGTISGARANANPLTKAWQGRMDHLNLFLREMHAPQELRRKTRQYMRNTRELHLKRSFNTLYGHFSKQLAGEMMAHMSISVVKSVYFFKDCERDFLRDLACKLQYEAYDMGEKVFHEDPTLAIVVRGTLVTAGAPCGTGEYIGKDVLLRSAALRDKRTSVALTYCEICCLTKVDIETTMGLYPNSAKHLRYEAFKIAMYRSAQLVSNYVDRSKNITPKTVAEALSNLGEDVSNEHAEVHTYFRAISGGSKLRGLAREQEKSSDLNVARKAREAVALTQAAANTDRANKLVIDEEGNVVDEGMKVDGLSGDLTAEQKMSLHMKELQAEIKDLGAEFRKTLSGLRHQSTKIIHRVSDVHARTSMAVDRTSMAEVRAQGPQGPQGSRVAVNGGGDALTPQPPSAEISPLLAVSPASLKPLLGSKTPSGKVLKRRRIVPRAAAPAAAGGGGGDGGAAANGDGENGGGFGDSELAA